MTAAQALRRPTRPAVRLAAVVLAVELALVLAHAAFTPGRILSPRHAAYPFVWINAGLVAMWVVSPPSTSARRGAVAAGIAAAYFGLLALLTGLVGVYPQGADPLFTGWQVSSAAPGWGPRVAYVGSAFHVYFVPYRVFGYLALAYLTYVAVLDAMRSALPAAVGVGSCIGCALPLLAPGVLGASGGAATAGLSTFSVDVSTALFLASVGLLTWRPRA